MSLFANRWRTLREVLAEAGASSGVKLPEDPPVVMPLRRTGKLRDRLQLQQDGQPGTL
jgi:hypothetical protein